LNSHFDFCVIGAGLAGMHVALELVERGASICVVDPRGIAGGASGTPVGLANPATGRYASRSWNAEVSLNHLTSRLLQAQYNSASKLFKQTGVLRPAMDEKIASRMRNNLKNDEWEPESVTWFDENELKSFHPGINCVEGGVWVRNGLTVHIPEYLNALEVILNERYCIFILGDQYELLKDDTWKLRFHSGNEITFKTAIFTAGIWTSHSDIWTHLKMHAVKGQTLILNTEKTIPFDHAVSALGYFSKIGDKSLIYGSTYEHKFDHNEPDLAGQEYMLKRFQRVLPALAKKSQVLSNWASIRASTLDRKPYIGAHNTIEDCYVFTGLGSKGLLYSSFGAQILVDHILKNESIPLELDLNRFQ
jgi:glycine/D-amino acid oxidase-like deaminating enzyme